jgi:hypothetical protein
MDNMQTIVRAVLAPFLDDARNADLITSYSFRRVGPTLMDIRKGPWPERMALGGWREQLGQAPKETKSLMPIRYSATRLQQEAMVKMQQACFLSLICEAEAGASWADAQAWCEREAAQATDPMRQTIANILAEAQKCTQPAYGYEEEAAEGFRRQELRIREEAEPRSKSKPPQPPVLQDIPPPSPLLESKVLLPTARPAKAMPTSAKAIGTKRPLSSSASEEMMAGSTRSLSSRPSSRAAPKSPTIAPVHTVVWLHTAAPAAVLHLQAQAVLRGQEDVLAEDAPLCTWRRAEGKDSARSERQLVRGIDGPTQSGRRICKSCWSACQAERPAWIESLTPKMPSWALP